MNTLPVRFTHPHAEVPTRAHPTDAGGRQLIDLLEGMQFSRGSAVKYLVRAGHKNPATELEDLRKAAWYINREITRLEGENR